MRHIIKKQVLDFRLKNKPGLFSIQQEMVEYNTKVILSLLEKVMNELCMEDEMIHLDKLELDLGVLAFKDLKKAASSDKLYEKIRSQIKEAIRLSAEQNNSFRQTKKYIGVGRQWLFYMEHGYLDWNTIEVNEDWYNEVLEAFALDFNAVTDLRKLILGNQRALTRIVQQHSDFFLAKITEILTARNQSDITGAVDELSEIISVLYSQTDHRITLAKVQLRETLWELVLTVAAPASGDSTTLQLISKILKRFIPDVATAKAILKEVSTQIQITEPFFVELLNQDGISINEILLLGGDTTSEAKKTDPFNDRFEIISQRPEKSEAQSDTEEEEDTLDFAEDITTSSERDKDDLGDDPPVKEEIFTANAGLVLLHPFLGTFFNKRKLVIENKFVNRSAKRKAIHLLHYLSTGSAEANEFELVIPKLLCSYPLHAAIGKRAALNPEDLDEANNLLAAAIDQWTILKNSSITALREGFLQRRGKLYVKNDNRYLHVEAGSIDILLDYLPWNFSIIKLPWMKEMLRVEWR